VSQVNRRCYHPAVEHETSKLDFPADRFRKQDRRCSWQDILARKVESGVDDGWRETLLIGRLYECRANKLRGIFEGGTSHVAPAIGVGKAREPIERRAEQRDAQIGRDDGSEKRFAVQDNVLAA
jgi:hypothetical protein